MDRKKHILIVDDVTTNLKVAADVLKDNYFHGQIRSSGA